MKENKNILFSALNYTIAEYLEGCNTSPKSRCLREKIERPPALPDAQFDEMIKIQNSYCGCPENELREEKGTKFFQDHIPWNFVRELQHSTGMLRLQF